MYNYLDNKLVIIKVEAIVNIIPGRLQAYSYMLPGSEVLKKSKPEEWSLGEVITQMVKDTPVLLPHSSHLYQGRP